MIIYFLVAVSFAVACDIYDVTLTQRGIKAGVDAEANTEFVGAKPTARALYLRDGLFMLLVTSPSIVGLVIHNPAVCIGGLAGPIVAGIKHISGGLKWSKLLNKH